MSSVAILRWQKRPISRKLSCCSFEATRKFWWCWILRSREWETSDGEPYNEDEKPFCMNR